MFRSQTANLPPEQQKRLHADFVANEQTYFRLRDKLVSQYLGQWVAVHNGQVIAADPDLVRVTDQAAASGGHPYIARVGSEDQVIFRIRRQESDPSSAPGVSPSGISRLRISRNSSGGSTLICSP
jgi:hypothetical protein